MIRKLRLNWMLLPAALCLALAACSSKDGERPGDRMLGDYKIGQPYKVRGIWYYPKVDYNYRETGIASWYGPGFHGKETANGEIYDQAQLTAAHRTLPLPSMVRVTNLENGRSVVVRVNDRGPFKNGRIIDLSLKTAQLLGFEMAGIAKVRVEILEAESRRIAAIAQGPAAARHAPKAAPMVAVDAAPLSPVESDPSAAVSDRPVAPAADTQGPMLAAGVSLGQDPGQGRNGTRATRATGGPPRPARSWPKRAELQDLDGESTPHPSTLEASQLALAPAKVAADADGGESRDTNGEARVGSVRMPWPDGVVTQLPIRETNIFVQAGSFLRRDYATRLSVRLSVLGKSMVTLAQVGERTFYRVRLGPITSVNEADRLLDVLQTAGIVDARVIVD